MTKPPQLFHLLSLSTFEDTITLALSFLFYKEGCCYGAKASTCTHPQLYYVSPVSQSFSRATGCSCTCTDSHALVSSRYLFLISIKTRLVLTVEHTSIVSVVTQNQGITGLRDQVLTTSSSTLFKPTLYFPFPL